MTKRRNDETAEKILDAALVLWSEKGYENATMRELARRLGMGASSLYFYFDSKEAIVQHLYRTLNQRALAAFRAKDDGDTDLGKNIAHFIAEKMSIIAPHQGCLSALLREAIAPASGLSPFSRDSSPTLAMTVGFFEELVTRSQLATGEKAKRLARLAWGAHLAVLLYWMHDPSSGKTNSKLLLEKLPDGTRLLPFVMSLPGADDYLGLIDALFEPPQEPRASAEPETSDKVVGKYDVIVLGAGPIGILFSCFLRKHRPRTRILVLDKDNETGHKIGESTLSGFCKALRTIGVAHEAMQRLFYPKNGLGFFHLDESTEALQSAPEYILETFDETFQVERRVLDTLLVEQARKLGVEVIRGAKVDLECSTFGAKGNIIQYAIGTKAFRMGCSLVADATGPASILSRHFDLRTSGGTPFQTSSAWSYYAGIRPLADYSGWPARAQAPRDEYTQHLCFREGWLWYIPLLSWQESPAVNLTGLLSALGTSKSRIPSRDELETRHGCPTRPIASIGLTLRSDRDRHLHSDPQGALAHYRQRYPALGRFLEGATPLGDYYGTGQACMSRQSMRVHARRVAGDGWLLIGEAAFFVDPLISPGLTGGAAQAFRGALTTARALDARIFERDFLADYETYVRDLHDALERDNQLVYMSFNHPDALALIQRFQEIDARRHFNEHDGDYGLADTNVWGILDASYQSLQRQAWQVMREEEGSVERDVSIDEQAPRDYERMVTRLHGILDRYVEVNRDLTPYARDNRP